MRSNRQGRGVWADMLGAGSMLRLLVSNASTARTPSTPPKKTHTHIHTPHTPRKRWAIDGEAGTPAVTWRTPLDSWRLRERRRCQTCPTEQGVVEVQGWARPEVAPIPAADHQPIICNYLHLYTSEINSKTHVHSDTQS